jgi:hypothetical protein
VPDRILTQRELRLALLDRQMLLRRTELPLTKVIERMGLLQTQYAPSAYIGLWSRLEGFERSHLTTALERRRVIQATMLRATIHMSSRRDFWPVVEAVQQARRAWWLRATRQQGDEGPVRAAAEQVRAFLADGPRRRKEIVAALDMDSTAWNGTSLWLDLVRVPPSGTWDQRRADLYDLAETWVGPNTASHDDGVALLVRRYLTGFGPASRGDIASWAGLPVTTIDGALARTRLRRFEDEAGGALVDLPGAPIPAPDTPTPVRFLPTWDATLLVHARRTQILPEALRPKIFHTKTPHSFPTFLVDGQVAGTWRYEKGRISLSPLRRLHRGERRAVDDEAERIEAFMA